MAQIESIKRYALILNKLKMKPASFEEVLAYLKVESEIQSYDFVVSKRTFQRDLNDIRTIYGIEITYDKLNKVYYWDKDASSPVNQRILEAYNTFNALSVSERMSEHIDFENRSTRGAEHLFGVLHCAKNKVQIRFSYQSYYQDKSNVRSVEPYFVKEYKRRWYLICIDCFDKRIKSFALDRMNELEISRIPFENPKPNNIERYYDDSFGIVGPNLERPAEEIILEFTAHQGKYIKSLPLHHSQEVIEEGSEFVRIKLQLHVTHDFIMELLSHGKELRVISPSSLVDQIKETLILSLDHYK